MLGFRGTPWPVLSAQREGAVTLQANSPRLAISPTGLVNGTLGFEACNIWPFTKVSMEHWAASRRVGPTPVQNTPCAGKMTIPFGMIISWKILHLAAKYHPLRLWMGQAAIHQIGSRTPSYPAGTSPPFSMSAQPVTAVTAAYRPVTALTGSSLQRVDKATATSRLVPLTVPRTSRVPRVVP